MMTKIKEHEKIGDFFFQLFKFLQNPTTSNILSSYTQKYNEEC